jgi:hypothetical protein
MGTQEKRLGTAGLKVWPAQDDRSYEQFICEKWIAQESRRVLWNGRVATLN